MFDRETFQISADICGPVESYIDENYVQTHEIRRRQAYSEESQALFQEDFLKNLCSAPMQDSGDVGDLLDNLDEPTIM